MVNPTMIKDNLIQLYYSEHKTLQEIGNKYNISRERVRQIMERFNLPRYTSNRGKTWTWKKAQKFQNLNDYFEHVKNTGKESPQILLKFISPLKEQCEECASVKHLHIHHLKYPATSRDDIQILCASCHFTKHRKGNGIYVQLKICDEYIKGKSTYRIGNEHQLNHGLVYQILRKWNIKTRTASQAMQLYFKHAMQSS